MCVTAGSIATFIASPVVVDYVKQNDWVMWTCLGLYLFTAFAIICCGEMRRKHPHGIICLSVLTIAMSVMVGVISAQYDTQTVLWAALMTCGCVFGLTLFAFQTKYDFTMFGGILCSICLVFLMSMMVFFWFPMSHTVNLVYSGLGALLMCFFIVYDTQLMLGGKHKLAIGLDEYVFAALNLYLDIINLFLYLLQILGGGRR
jgi:FtsH-binding integral membrane protein